MLWLLVVFAACLALAFYEPKAERGGHLFVESAERRSRDSFVTAAKIASGSITASEISAGAITASKIAGVRNTTRC